MFDDIMEPFHNWVSIWSEIGGVRHYNYNRKRLRAWEKSDSMIVKHLRRQKNGVFTRLDQDYDLNSVYSQDFTKLIHISLLSELPFEYPRIAPGLREIITSCYLFSVPSKGFIEHGNYLDRNMREDQIINEYQYQIKYQVELTERVLDVIELVHQAILKQRDVYNLDSNHFDFAFGTGSYNYAPEPVLRSCCGLSGIMRIDSIPIFERPDTEYVGNDYRYYSREAWMTGQTVLHRKWVLVNKDLKLCQVQFEKVYNHLIGSMLNTRILRDRLYCALLLVTGKQSADKFLLARDRNCNIILGEAITVFEHIHIRIFKITHHIRAFIESTYERCGARLTESCTEDVVEARLDNLWTESFCRLSSDDGTRLERDRFDWRAWWKTPFEKLSRDPYVGEPRSGVDGIWKMFAEEDKRKASLSSEELGYEEYSKFNYEFVGRLENIEVRIDMKRKYEENREIENFHKSDEQLYKEISFL